MIQPVVVVAEVQRPPRYPLELTEDLEICLWSPCGGFKWTVARWWEDDEGPELHFLGDRPLNERVNWEHFHELVVEGQAIAMQRFRERFPEYYQNR